MSFSSPLLPLDSPLHDRFRFRVAAYGCDPQQRLRLPDLIRELQEAALQSTLRLGVSVYDLAPLGLGWVLLGQQIVIQRMPLMNESCEVVTCPVGFERVFTFRDFHLLSDSGQPLATATTTWMLMDLSSRKMASLPAFIKGLDAQKPPAQQCLPPAPYKLVLPKAASLTSNSFTVGYHHLDSNGHLSNAFYPQWMLEALPKNFLETRQLCQLSTQFKKEAHYGDQLQTALTQVDPLHYQHSLLVAEEPIATMQSHWV